MMSDTYNEVKTGGRSKAKSTVLCILLLVVMFAAGFAVTELLSGKLNLFTKQTGEETYEIKVYDGTVEFFDGKSWQVIDSADKMQADDPMYKALSARLETNNTQETDGDENGTPQRAGGNVVKTRPRTSTQTTTVTDTGGGGGGGSAGEASTDEWSKDYD